MVGNSNRDSAFSSAKMTGPLQTERVRRTVAILESSCGPKQEAIEISNTLPYF